MTALDSARKALFHAATSYAAAINAETPNYDITMEVAGDLEALAIRFAKEWNKEVKEWQAIGREAERATLRYLEKAKSKGRR